MRCTNKKQREEKRQRRQAQLAAENGYTEREWKRINAQDRRERERNLRLLLMTIVMAAFAALMAYLVWYNVFRSHDQDLRMPYSGIASIGQMQKQAGQAEGFAQDLCVTNSDVDPTAVTISALSAGLFDLTNEKVVYGKDLFTHRSEASLTKIMTALVALKYGNLDDQVVTTDTALDIEYGSSVCNIQPGDTLTLRQLLYGLLIASGNDAAMMIAEHVGGSVDNFVSMMNAEAIQIGATQTAFKNPSGLTQEGHYTCLYDVYLMFNAAMQYDVFMDIIGRTNYYAEYTSAAGTPAAMTWESTNHYFTGEARKPDDVIIYGGKTGTTEDAGACLSLLTKDAYGNPYISVILHAQDKDILYQDMNALLAQIPK